jgi:hypothetical protein
MSPTTILWAAALGILSVFGFAIWAALSYIRDRASLDSHPDWPEPTGGDYDS